MNTVFAFSTLIAALQCASAAPSLKLIAEVKGFSSPESAAWDGTHFYVSNVGKELKPTEKDGDGFISRMDADGKNLKLDFISGLNAPKGLQVIGKTLYVCDIDVLLGFDLTTREKTFEVSFAKDGVSFLNDVCSAGNDKLMVSATDKNAVYLVDLKEKSAKPLKFSTPPNGPNGLVFVIANQEEEHPYLLVVEWGSNGKPNGNVKIYSLDGSLLLANEEEKPDNIPIKDGYLDGAALIAKDGSSEILLFTDWVAFQPGGKLLLSDPEEQNTLIDLTIPNGPVAGPADFLYIAKSATLVLPCMMEGRVLIMKLESIK